MRAACAIALFLACAWLGARKRAKLDARLQALCGFLSDIRRLRDIMELSPIPIAEAASRLKSGIWELFVGGMQSAGAPLAWEKALDESPEFADDRDVIEGFGEALRLVEMRAQLNALTLMMRELEERKLALAAELEKKGKMYSSLGVLLGLSLALLVI
ncbi:MAG TPA: hypothetical protein VN540_02870 [Clostridia bacterium]|nr:hypothetical protein [Clostridia bacterium]